MNPILLDVIERKKAIIRQELGLLKELAKQPISPETDLIIRHALCHSMQNAITAVIDIAQHIVTEKSEAALDSYADSIEKLGDLKVLDRQFACEFSRAAKLRNVLVHLYDNVDIAFLASLLPKLITDLQRFVRELKP